MSPVPTNHLAQEKSPYLRQHAHNPVDWHPWGEEAFARARAEQKPIFLSIGYSTCHWCHVMAHESFEDPVIAAELNRNFVPVKVDREERPDVDRVYMTYMQAATGQGGWPLSVWLTPDLQPFYGGTYFPPKDRWGRPGFATLLAVLAQAWANQREKLIAEGARVTDALRAYSANARASVKGRRSKGQGPEEQLEDAILETQDSESGSSDALAAAAGEAFDRCCEQLAASFDPLYGGFGGAPKFPRASVFNFLFRVTAIQGAISEAGVAALEMATVTLRQMSEGGLHDHVGGGFHRYSMDEEWFVPHFEKMLYDQAQLAASYLEAYQATGDERYAGVARGIFDYVLRDLANPAGGFFCAEDADSPLPAEKQTERRRPKVEGQQAEGAFYVWTKAELARVLAADAELFCTHFGVEDVGNVPAARDPHGELRGENILRQRQTLATTTQQFGLDQPVAGDRLLACLTRLREERARRPRPHCDDKILAAWNGLMISAFAKGHQVLGLNAGRDGPPGRPSDSARPSNSARASTDKAVTPYLQAAVRTAEFLRRELYDESTGTLHRSYCEGRSDIPGFAEDYAYLIQGLLDLYEASFEIRWLQWAGRLQAKMDADFWDADAGGYFNSRADDPTIIARLKEDYDGAEPAPGSVAALNLLRLDAMIGVDPNSHEFGYQERGRRCLEALRGQWERAPHALPQMLCAMELLRAAPRTVVIAGDPQAEDFRRLTGVVHGRLGPRRILLAASGEGQRWWATRLPHVAEMKMQDGHATAYVCENAVCLPPVTDPAALRQMLT